MWWRAVSIGLVTAAGLVVSVGDRVIAEDSAQAGEFSLGDDARGVPRLCGTTFVAEPEAAGSLEGGGATLEPNERTWETSPGVVRDDGTETFRLEVGTSEPGVRVEWRVPSGFLELPSPAPIELTDDGLGADRVAGDGVFTVGPLRYVRPSWAPTHWGGDPESPEGVYWADLGRITFVAEDGSEDAFLIEPVLGVVSADIEAPYSEQLAEDVVATDHLVAISTSGRHAERRMRHFPNSLTGVTRRFYELMDDDFDFIVFLSGHKVERAPRTTSQNAIAGLHLRVRTDYTGTGHALGDGTATWGSAGRLLSVNLADAYDRGIASDNVTHEITHQWAAFLTTSLGITDGTAHYRSRSSAASLVGGFRWVDNGDGTFDLDCTQGRNGAHRAPPLDRYLAGFTDGADVGRLRAYAESIPAKCLLGEPVLPEEIVADIDLDDIQAVYGPREPGPESAQKDFRVAFILESNERLPTPTELTYYEILAAHYEKLIPAGEPDPYHGSGWTPVTRYWGEGVTWSSRVLPPPGRQVRGDANQDGEVDIADPVALLVALFVGYAFELPCGDGTAAHAANVELLDWTGDAQLDVSDAIGSLLWLFAGGPAHPLYVGGEPSCDAIRGCPDVCE